MSRLTLLKKPGPACVVPVMSSNILHAAARVRLRHQILVSIIRQCDGGALSRSGRWTPAVPAFSSMIVIGPWGGLYSLSTEFLTDRRPVRSRHISPPQARVCCVRCRPRTPLDSTRGVRQQRALFGDVLAGTPGAVGAGLFTHHGHHEERSEQKGAHRHGRRLSEIAGVSSDEARVEID